MGPLQSPPTPQGPAGLLGQAVPPAPPQGGPLGGGQNWLQQLLGFLGGSGVLAKLAGQPNGPQTVTPAQNDSALRQAVADHMAVLAAQAAAAAKKNVSTAALPNTVLATPRKGGKK